MKTSKRQPSNANAVVLLSLSLMEKLFSMFNAGVKIVDKRFNGDT